MNRLKHVRILVLIAISLLQIGALSMIALAHSPAKYNEVWNSPSNGSINSMPLGNGDIGLNVWMENSGDVVFYISKTDAWDASGELVKVGRIRLRLKPALRSSMCQKLSLEDGSILISGRTGMDEVSLRIWVDANRPVIWVESFSCTPVGLVVSVELWRNHEQCALRFQTNKVVFYQRDESPKFHVAKGAPDPFSGRCFGGLMRGAGMINEGNESLSLKSTEQAKSHLLRISILSAQAKSEDEFLSILDKLGDSMDSVKVADAWAAHVRWWKDFWNRSWVDIESKSDPDNAFAVSRAYALQRFVVACAGRGNSPIKFNGSIFTMDTTDNDMKHVWPVNADFRHWGAGYWFQNTRWIYWPMLCSGDFEMMKPFFKMYADLTPALAARSEAIHKHPGAEFFETITPWGNGWISPSTERNWNGSLEFLTMLLDYYSYSGDRQVLEKWLIPMGKAYLDFFDHHFPRENGKLKLTPSHANEMYWDVVNPTPDIAGLHCVLNSLLRLPLSDLPQDFRAQCVRMRSELPPIPLTDSDWAASFRSADGNKFPFPESARPGAICIAPAATIQDKHPRNCENPELYAVFPFRIFGVNRPDIDVGIETYHRRLFSSRGHSCWRHEEVDAACLGLADDARKALIIRNKHSLPCRFSGFRGPGYDYIPDMDHGGVLMTTLHLMLLQSNADGELHVFPAWPAQWDVDFKLRAPGGKTVKATLKDGKVVKMEVTPQTEKVVLDKIQ